MVNIENWKLKNKFGKPGNSKKRQSKSTDAFGKKCE